MKIKFLLPIVFVSLILFYFLYKLAKEDEKVKGKVIKRALGYTVSSNLGLVVPASLFIEDSTKSKDDSIFSPVYVLVFDTSLSLLDSTFFPDVLVIHPKGKYLMMSWLSNNSFIPIDAKKAYQKDKILDEEGVVNNTVEFSNPPIKSTFFYKNKVVFNTYGPLKKWGDSIIVTLPN